MGRLKPIPNDTSRCYGQGCEERDSCWRFRTMAVDPIDVRAPYVATYSEDGLTCNYFKPLPDDDEA